VININIKNLYQYLGKIIKNYKELCKILNIEVKAGDSKMKQLAELALYCDYSRKGNGYIINKIFEHPVITLNDLIKTKNSKYIKLLSNIIVEYLYNNPKELQQIPLLKLFSILGIANTNYSDSNYYRKELSQLYNIQLASIYYFYSNTRREYKRIIERCLNNLQSRRVLNWNRCVMIIDRKNKRTYKADKETEKEIINMEKQALEHLNINNMYELMRDKNKLKEFNNILKKEMGFEYYYAYDLTIGDIALKIEYNNIKNERIQLNKLIIDKTNNLFDKPIFNSFETDYKILIELLVNLESNIELKEILKDKHSENMCNYIADSLGANRKYKKEIEQLKDKYLDKYQLKE
jgi:hypothetical protein